MYNTSSEYNVLVHCKVNPSQLVFNLGCSLELLGGAFKNTYAKFNPKDSNLSGMRGSL